MLQQQLKQMLQHSGQGLLTAAVSLLLACQSPWTAPAAAAGSAPPLFDAARVVASEQRATLVDSLERLESEAGWKVRVYSAYGGALTAPRDTASPRELWGPPDARTLWLKVDPSSPNILNMVYVGDDVLFKLRRPFLQEVQSRYGNIFFVRDNGENAAVVGAVGALTNCLAAPEGCKVVPGLPGGQYWFTFAFSVAGGLIAGAVSKLEPQGIVQRKWVWLLIFSPLWGPLFINYGIGPVVSRTSDVLPVAGNCAGFLLGAALPYLDRVMAPPTQPQGGGGSSGQS